MTMSKKPLPLKFDQQFSLDFFEKYMPCALISEIQNPQKSDSAAACS
jgi:hypothetical protein